MTKRQEDLCNGYIHGASVAAGSIGAGFAQIPGSDNLLITPIQVGMIIALGGVFNKSVTETAALTILSELTAGYVGRTLSQVVVGWIPGLGNAINATTAFGITEGIGWLAVKHFDEIETIEN